ncbi:hypothetical protein L6164_029484 [Bauhinia variegata]|uniref:Uncharacterized protein n=1 Tax=Bauhinia variegata TaxID=167791 RepID=A0ACB9L9R6_BAUVA|nr:hypothetical protein L6164_029484 [Bauhinia variegata]
MHALWGFLKGTVHCGSKVRDVVSDPIKCGKRSSDVSNDNMDTDNGCSVETLTGSVISRQISTPTQLHELSSEDPSRKIVEMIFQKAWTNTARPLRKVRTVFRVNNSAQVLERFDKYREKVKQKAAEQYPKHTRSIVDGNELLRFYGTSISCCHGKSNRNLYDLCKDPSCRLCRIIQSNFDQKCIKQNGFELNSISEIGTNANTRAKNVKRAVIVCRVIAGVPVNEIDDENEGRNTTGSEEQQLSLEEFVVENPSAVLPCFVIVFSWRV